MCSFRKKRLLNRPCKPGRYWLPSRAESDWYQKVSDAVTAGLMKVSSPRWENVPCALFLPPDTMSSFLPMWSNDWNRWPCQRGTLTERQNKKEKLLNEQASKTGVPGPTVHRVISFRDFPCFRSFFFLFPTQVGHRKSFLSVPFLKNSERSGEGCQRRKKWWK